MVKRITRTVTSYQTERDGVIKNNLSMQYMDIATWKANCEMVEKGEK